MGGEVASFLERRGGLGRLWVVSVVLCASLATEPADAQTIVDQSNIGSATWTAEGSPYLVMQNTKFDVLTVGPATHILIAEGADRIGLEGNTLVVEATLDAPAVFEPELDGDGLTWGGIEVVDADVAGAVIRRAVTGLFVSSGTIRQSRFEANRHGIYALGEGVVIDGVFMSNLEVGIFAGNDTTIINSVFVDNGVDGVACNSGPCTIINSTFVANAIGVFGSFDVLVQNSVFVGSTRYAIESDVVEVSHCLFWENVLDAAWLGTQHQLSADDGNRFADPGFVDVADYHLTENSPCIGGGDAWTAPDHDADLNPRPAAGTRGVVDIGAFEFQPVMTMGGAGGGAGQGGATTGQGGAATGQGGAGGRAPATEPDDEMSGSGATAGLSGDAGAVAGGANGAGGTPMPTGDLSMGGSGGRMPQHLPDEGGGGGSLGVSDHPLMGGNSGADADVPRVTDPPDAGASGRSTDLNTNRAAEASQPSGCGCRVVGEGARRGTSLWLFLALILVWTERRRASDRRVRQIVPS